MNWLLVVVGAMVGAPLRYLIGRAVEARNDTLFPWGTFTVNVVGCLVFGLLTGAVTYGGAPASVRLLVGAGVCGTLTTYSAFSYETVRLAEIGARLYAVANVLASVASAIGAAFIGAALAEAMWA
ncbi:fluoride efflux transporter CrcB [Streptomyces flaveus]|uniref:fluoride efflux transporter CrcB n=1 Tax=Streptomyces flaveus TaxID=66370 RepID=UPI00331BD703